MGELYDVFVSHASEDKDEIAHPLVEKLQKLGMKVWYDESNITYGDVPLKRMDEGLTRSTSGIIIISYSFFNKKYTIEELYALLDASIEEGKKIFLILHNMTKQELREHSPILATKRYFRSDEGLDKIAEKVCEHIRIIQNGKPDLKKQNISGVSSQEEYVFFAKWDLKDELDKFYYNEGIVSICSTNGGSIILC